MTMLIVVVMILVLSSITTSNGWVECDEKKRIGMYEQYRNCTDEQYHVFHEQQCSENFSENSSEYLCQLLENLVEKCGIIWTLCHDFMEIQNLKDRQVVAVINNLGHLDIEQCNIIKQYSESQPFRKLNSCSEKERQGAHQELEHCSYNLSSTMNNELHRTTKGIQQSRLICDNLKNIETTCIDTLTNCYAGREAELILKMHVEEMKLFFVRYINSIMPNITSLDCEADDISEAMVGRHEDLQILLYTNDADRNNIKEKHLNVSSEIVGYSDEILLSKTKEIKDNATDDVEKVYFINANTIEKNITSNVQSYGNNDSFINGLSNTKDDIVTDVSENKVIPHFEDISLKNVQQNSTDEELNIIPKVMNINMTSNIISNQTENVTHHTTDPANINNKEKDYNVEHYPTKSYTYLKKVNNMAFSYENLLDDHEKNKIEEDRLEVNEVYSPSEIKIEENRVYENVSKIKMDEKEKEDKIEIQTTQTTDDIERRQLTAEIDDEESIETKFITYPLSTNQTGVNDIKISDEENLKSRLKDKHPQTGNGFKQESNETKRFIHENKKGNNNMENIDEIMVITDENREADQIDSSTQTDFLKEYINHNIEENLVANTKLFPKIILPNVNKKDVEFISNIKNTGDGFAKDLKQSPSGTGLKSNDIASTQEKYNNSMSEGNDENFDHKSNIETKYILIETQNYSDKYLDLGNVVERLSTHEYKQVEDTLKGLAKEEVGLTFNKLPGPVQITKEDNHENRTKNIIHEPNILEESDKIKSKIKFKDIIHDISASLGIESEDRSERISLNKTDVQKEDADLQYGWTIWSTKVRSSMAEIIEPSKYFDKPIANVKEKSIGGNNKGFTIRLTKNLEIYLFIYMFINNLNL